MASLVDWKPTIREEDEEATLLAMRLACGSALQMAVRAALELGLLDILVKAGPDTKLSAVDVVAQLPASNPEAGAVVDRILCMLAANGIVRCTVDAAAATAGGIDPLRRYGPAPVCKYLAKNEDEGSLGPLHMIGHDRFWMGSWLISRSLSLSLSLYLIVLFSLSLSLSPYFFMIRRKLWNWKSRYCLKDAVVEGGFPFEKANKMTVFDYISENPEFGRLMNNCMKATSTIYVRKLVEIYGGFDDHKIQVLVDVGGGFGATLGVITSKHPHIKGINFDLPHVISQATPLPRVEHIGGDMFESVPSGDAILMKSVLHDWSDEQCVKILGNCRRALGEKGKVIVYECMLPEAIEPSLQNEVVFQLDLFMLAYTPGGKERTPKQYQTLANLAGFTGFKPIYISCGMGVMELTK